MKNINFKKNILPHIIALTILFVIISAFFSPVFSGKTLKQGDAIEHIGISREIEEYREEFGEQTLWTNTVFSGMPTYMVSARHYGQLISYWFFKTKKALLPPQVNIIFIGSIAFYILMISMGIPIHFAVLGAIGFSFSTYNFVSLEAGHNSKVYTTMFLPLLLSGVLLVAKGKYLKGMVISSIATALMVGAAHYQIIYYFLLALVPIFLYFLIDDIKKKDYKTMLTKIGIIAFAAILGVGSSSAKLICDFSYLPNSTRGIKELKKEGSTEKNNHAMDYDYAFSWSQGILETATLVIPYYYGGSSSENLGKKSNLYKDLKSKTQNTQQANQISSKAPTYWGKQPFTSGPIYFGATIFFLFILAFFSWKSKFKYYVLSAIILLTFISWGGNFKLFNYFLFDYFPGMNKFRSVSMALSVVQLLVVLIATVGLYEFTKTENGVIKKKILLQSIGTAVGFTVLLIVIGLTQSFTGTVDGQLAQWPEWLKDSLIEDRKSLLLNDGIRSLLFMIGSAAALYLILIKKTTLQVGIIILTLISLVDVWTVNKRYIYNDKFKKETKQSVFTPTEASKKIQEDKSYYRVFNQTVSTFNDNSTSYFHNSIGGYRPAKMQRYQDIIENCLTKGNMNVINMLNTKYVIKGPNAKDAILNPGALGNAWFVSSIKEVNNANEEMVAINDKNWNPKSEAVINVNQYKTTHTEFAGTGTVTLKNYKANELVYDVDASDASFIVFSDVFYPEDWDVLIDDERVDFKRVNYIIRGLEVPKGKHTITCSFKPTLYASANMLSLVFSLVILALLGFYLYKSANGQSTSVDEE